jgi:hypothetical protein
MMLTTYLFTFFRISSTSGLSGMMQRNSFGPPVTNVRLLAGVRFARPKLDDSLTPETQVNLRSRGVAIVDDMMKDNDTEDTWKCMHKMFNKLLYL